FLCPLQRFSFPDFTLIESHYFPTKFGGKNCISPFAFRYKQNFSRIPSVGPPRHQGRDHRRHPRWPVHVVPDGRRLVCGHDHVAAAPGRPIGRAGRVLPVVRADAAAVGARRCGDQLGGAGGDLRGGGSVTRFADADYLGTFPAGSPEWLALRADGLGGSEIAAVLGLSPFESRFSLWHRKRGEAAPQAETEERKSGKYFEPGIVEWFRDTHPDYRVRRAGTYRSKARPWQIA